MLAAGIAFNILLYLLPMFLVAVYVVNLVFGAENLSSSLEKILIDLLPPDARSADFLNGLVGEVNSILAKSTFFGWIGMGVLLWISSTLISSLRTGLNAVFRLHSPNIFVFYRLKDIYLTLVMTILVMLYSYAVPIITVALTFINEYFPDKVNWILSEVAFNILSLLTSFGLFYFIFRSVPNKKLPRTIRLIATGSSLLLIELSRYVFAWYIGSISNYGRFYGTYAVIVSIALWIYYSSLMILISAELAKFIYDLKKTGGNNPEIENGKTTA